MRIESNRKVPRTNRLSLGVLDMYEVFELQKKKTTTKKVYDFAY